MILKCKCRFTKRNFRAILFTGDNKEEIDKFVGDTSKEIKEDGSLVYRVMEKGEGLTTIKLPEGHYLMHSQNTGYIVIKSESYKSTFKLIA